MFEEALRQYETLQASTIPLVTKDEGRLQPIVFLPVAKGEHFVSKSDVMRIVESVNAADPIKDFVRGAIAGALSQTEGPLVDSILLGMYVGVLDQQKIFDDTNHPGYQSMIQDLIAQFRNQDILKPVFIESDLN